MTTASIIALLQTALMLLQLAQGTGIEQSLKNHAMTIAQQAITSATVALTTPANASAPAPLPSPPDSSPAPVAQSGSSSPTPSRTIFYVDNTCAVNGNGTAAGCASVVQGNGAFNSLTAMTGRSGGYAPGSQILLRRGNTYREMLVMPSSGTSDKPIRVGTYSDGPRPVILGSDRRTWTPEASGVYAAVIDWTPNLVLQGEVPLAKAASRAELTPGSYYLDGAQKIYVMPRGGAAPTEIEVTRRPQNYYGLVMDGWTGNSWIHFDGLEVRNSNWMSFRIFGGKGITVSDSVIKNGFHNGIIAMGIGQGAAADPDHLTITGNTIMNHGYARSQGHDGAAAISVDGADGFAIERNVVDTNYGEGIETYNTADNGRIVGNTVRNQQISGAIYVNASFGRRTSSISVKDNTISGGSDKAHTALIAAIEGSGVIDRITVVGNTISGYLAGGGLVVGSGQGSVSNSTFEGNAITSTLHGIEVLGQTGLTFSNNVFKGNTVSLSSNGSALLVTEGGATGNAFTGNSFANPGSTLPIFWLGKYYTVADWLTLMSGTQQVAPPPASAPDSTQSHAVSTSCVYGSNSGAVRTLSPADTKDACVSSCVAIRNSAFGVSDSGVCTFRSVTGIETQTTISPIACIYSSNTGSIQYAPVSTETTRQSCITSCASTRNQYYGATDTGVCLYYDSLGAHETIAM